MGHRDYTTTLIYADYAPRTHEKSLMERAFAPAQRLPFEQHDDPRALPPDPFDGP